MLLRHAAILIALTFIGSTMAHAQKSSPSWSSDFTVPGTEWVYAVLSSNGKPIQCEVELALPRGNKKRLIKFAILAKGSRTIAVLDEFIERPVRDSIGWKQGKSFKVVLFPRKGSITIDAHGTATDEEVLLIYLPQEQRALMDILYNAETLSIVVGGVAMKSYELPGLAKAIAQLNTCPIGTPASSATAQFDGIWVEDKKYCQNGKPTDLWWWVGTLEWKKGVNYKREENARDVIWGSGTFVLVNNTTIGCSLSKIKRHKDEITASARCDWDNRPKFGNIRIRFKSDDKIVVNFDNRTVDFTDVHLIRCSN